MPQPFYLQIQSSGVARATTLIREFAANLDGAVSEATESAAASASTATAKAAEAGADAAQAAADRVQTGLDRVATGADADATAADAVATAADRVQTGLDRVATAADVVTTAASRDAAEGFKDDAEAAAASLSAITGVIVNDPGQLVPWAVTDPDGNAALYMSGDELFTLKNPFLDELRADTTEATDRASTIVVDATQQVAHAITDEDGNAIFGVADDGELVGPGVDAMVAATTAARAVADKAAGLFYSDLIPTGDIEHDTYHGQSNSIGVGGLAITTAARTDALMFATGVAQEHAGSTDPAVLYAAFADLKAGQYPGTAYDYEDPALGIAQMYAERVLAVEGVATTALNQKILFTEPGREGQAIAAFGRFVTGGIFTRMVQGWTYGKALAAAAGKSYSLGVLGWDQGEANDGVGTSLASYKQSLKQFRVDAEIEARALLGKPDFRLPMIAVQVVSYKVSAALTGLSNPYPNVALAQLELATEDDMVALACPTYIFDFAGLHKDAIGHKVKGAYVGLARHTWKNLGRKPEWLRPVSAERQGKVIVLTYDPPSGRLAWGDDYVTDPGNYGFTVQKADYSATLTISDVRLVGLKQVVIELSADPGVPVEVQYAFNGGTTDAGRISGSRGCLRDTTGDTLTFDAADLDWPMHHWAPLHRFIID